MIAHEIIVSRKALLAVLKRIEEDTRKGSSLAEDDLAAGHLALRQLELLGHLTYTVRLFVRTATPGEIHRLFGAPGDWGYDTPLGDALFRFYDEEGVK